MVMKVIIYGAGQNGRIVLEILQSQNIYKVIGFIDDNKQLQNRTINNIPILGDSSCLTRLITDNYMLSAIVTIGDNEKRADKINLLKNIKFNLINVIHKKTIISKNVKFGENIQITAGAIINTGCKIGNNVIINTAATIDHDNEIGNNVQICPGVHLAGSVKLKDNAFIGTGSVIVNNITIGKNAIVGAGSVIIKDIPDNAVVVGIPGKVRQKIKGKLI